MTDLLGHLHAALSGRYAFEREIGRGGMATVFLAEDVKHHRKVAIKVLNGDLASSVGHQRFLREVEYAAKLSHPHIAPLLDSGDAGGSLYYVMPYAPGDSLRQRLARDGPLAIQEAVRIACDVAAALDYAHRCGVIHRDVKPENILFADDEAVVADFGIAAAMSRVAGETLTSIGLAVGTPAYMSPEQASGENRLDGRSDIYSLGCVLYEMLASEPPFIGATAQAVIAKRMSHPAPSVRVLREDVPEQLDRVLRRSLSRTPADRYRTAETLRRALESAMKEAEFGVESGRKPASLRADSSPEGPTLARTDRLRIESIAVLPFENISSNPSEEYFVAGIHDAIMGQLAQLGALRVASRTSVASYKQSGKTISEIARKLSVDAVMEGSVLSVGNNVRVHVAVVRAAPREERVWGQIYDRSKRDVLTLYNEVARAVADEMRVELTPEERTRLRDSRTVNSDAYRHYLIGNFQLGRYNEEGFRKALEHYRQAIAIDPRYAPAYAGQAVAYIELGSWASSLPPQAVYADARAAALAALETDPSLAEAHIALARIKQLFDWDWAGGEAEYRRGLELNPKALHALGLYGNYLTCVGRFEEAMAIGAQGIELDPVSPDGYFQVAWALYHLGHISEALEQFEKASELAPSDPSIWLEVAQIHGEEGRPEQAAAYAERAEGILGTSGPAGWLGRLGTAYALANRPVDARRIREQLYSRAQREYVPPSAAAVICAALGEIDTAIDLLEQGYEKRDVIMVWLKVRHHFDPLRGDPRFQDILRRMNFPD